MIELDTIYNEDCLEGMKQIPDGTIDCVVTDIPYGVVNRDSNGLRNLDKDAADIETFNLSELTTTLCRKSKGSVYMFCGTEQVSEIRRSMVELGLSTRIIVWEKTNPSPMNGEYIWLSGIELCVFGKKTGATFNEFCKNTVFRHAVVPDQWHPTQKPVDLIRRLILASTNESDVILDPFMGSGTTAIACIKERRHFIGFELSKEYFDKAVRRIKAEQAQLTLF